MPVSKFIKFLLLQFCTLVSFGQNQIKEFQFTQINWKLSVPIISKIQTSFIQDTILQISPTYIKERIIIEKDRSNTCEIKVRPSDPDSLKATIDAEAWAQSNKVVALIYSQENSDIKFFDSTSSMQIIDGVKFDIFYYNIKHANDPTYNVLMLTAKYDMHDINIFISYDKRNVDLGNYFLEILSGSKFGKGVRLLESK